MIYDVIVIGVGSMGSSTCYHLAKRGAKVLGIEQFGITHEHGSHNGESRLIRKAYFEHPNYVPLLRRAYDGWRTVEKESNTQLYWQTGLAYFGLSNCEMLLGVEESSELYDVPIEHSSALEISKRWPQFNLPEKYVGLFEPEAGFVKPELSIKTLVDLAKENGADIHTDEKVIEWRISKYVEVITNKTTYRGKKIIFTAGAFSEQLIKTKAPLTVTQQFMGWTLPLSLKGYSIENLPCWLIYEDEMDGPYYGFPEIDAQGMKVAYHRKGESVSADLDLNFLEREEKQILDDLLKKYLPEVGSGIDFIKRCKYTYSPDHDFIVDQLSEYDNRVLVASGFSGHGFKFVPIIGQALADFVLNEGSDLPIDFLRLSRFS